MTLPICFKFLLFFGSYFLERTCLIKVGWCHFMFFQAIGGNKKDMDLNSTNGESVYINENYKIKHWGVDEYAMKDKWLNEMHFYIKLSNK